MPRILKVVAPKTGSIMQIDLEDIKDVYIDNRRAEKLICIEYFKTKKLELKIDSPEKENELLTIFDMIIDARNEYHKEEKETKIDEDILKNLIERISDQNISIFKEIGLNNLKDEVSSIKKDLISFKKEVSDIKDDIYEIRKMKSEIKKITEEIHNQLFRD